MGRNSPKIITLPVTLLCALLAGVLLVSCTASGEPSARPAQPSPSPSAPTGPQRLGPAPQAVPSVREWEAERGPGWKPSEATRVVTEEGSSLAGEARLLASELDVPYATGDARTGDVELRTSDGGDTGREGYVLNSEDGGVRITANTDAGVFYGTRTLLQAVRGQGGIADGVVRDQPDRAQRGFSLDIARKFYEPEWIKDRIREMGDLKLNQLQLHLTDDQGFNIESDRHPDVVSEQYLTKQDVREIVRLAASRHITVIPEIDSPGHLGAVIEAKPELQVYSASGEAVQGAVDITDPAAARVVDDFIEEYAELFPGEYFHLGGDEYIPVMSEDPEGNYPELAAAARERFGPQGTVQDLATQWLNDRAETAREAGKTPQVWNDGMHADGQVAPDDERQVTYWTGKEIGEREPEEYLREGYEVVNMNDEYLYYVLGEPNEFVYPTGQRIYEEWTPAVVRGSEPVPSSLSGPERIVGGRFAVWGDIPDAQTTEQVAAGIRLPLAATAQKLWDPADPELSWTQFRTLVDEVAPAR